MSKSESKQNHNNSKRFFFKSDKKEYLVDCLLKNHLSYKSYQLILVSCYFRLNALIYFLHTLYKRQPNIKIKTSEIRIYIDKVTAIDIEKKELKELEDFFSSLRKIINVSLKIWNNNNLFHSKAYCLLATDQTMGSLVIGSANLTGNGITSPNGNMELLYDTQNINEITSFYEDLESLDFQDFDTPIAGREGFFFQPANLIY